MKKLLAIVLAACLALTLVACGGAPSSTPASGSASGSTAAAVSGDANVAVFYYTYSDTYISSVRSALDAKLDEMGVTYQDFDGAGQQTTQTEQVKTAEASPGTSRGLFMVKDRFAWKSPLRLTASTPSSASSAASVSSSAAT